jgi:hypothetical protein
MIHLFQPEVFVLRTDFGTQAPDYRNRIRTSLPTSPDILDLSKPPRAKDFYWSISHTTGLGGYAGSKTPLGLDIESSNRVIDTNVLARVTSRKVARLAPSPTCLWVAMEAALKAAWNANPRPWLIKDISVEGWSVSNWIELSATLTFQFVAGSKLSGTGWVRPGPQFHVAVASIIGA